MHKNGEVKRFVYGAWEICISLDSIAFEARAPEAVIESGAPARPPQAAPIKAQSAAVAPATGSICNAEWRRPGGMSGRGGFIHSLSGHADLWHEGEHKCRVALTGHFQDAARACDALERMAKAWINDWLARNGSGETGFAN